MVHGRNKFWIISVLIGIWILAGSMLSAGVWAPQVDKSLQFSPFAESERKQLRRVFEHAELQQIPVEILVLRLEEGLAKRISPQLLYEALMRELHAYEETRNLVLKQLSQDEATLLLTNTTIWSRTATLYQQGVPEKDLIALLGMFSCQSSKEKWNNYRYGGGLYIALQQWGLADELSLSVVEALSKSSIAGDEYRAILDLFNIGFANRVAPGDMAQRIIKSAPRSRSITMLERLVR